MVGLAPMVLELDRRSGELINDCWLRVGLGAVNRRLVLRSCYESSLYFSESINRGIPADVPFT